MASNIETQKSDMLYVSALFCITSDELIEKLGYRMQRVIANVSGVTIGLLEYTQLRVKFHQQFADMSLEASLKFLISIGDCCFIQFR